MTPLTPISSSQSLERFKSFFEDPKLTQIKQALPLIQDHYEFELAEPIYPGSADRTTWMEFIINTIQSNCKVADKTNLQYCYLFALSLDAPSFDQQKKMLYTLQILEYDHSENLTEAFSKLPGVMSSHILLYSPNVYQDRIISETLNMATLLNWIEDGFENTWVPVVQEKFLDIFAKYAPPHFFPYFEDNASSQVQHWVKSTSSKFSSKLIQE